MSIEAHIVAHQRTLVEIFRYNGIRKRYSRPQQFLPRQNLKIETELLAIKSVIYIILKFQQKRYFYKWAITADAIGSNTTTCSTGEASDKEHSSRSSSSATNARQKSSPKERQYKYPVTSFVKIPNFAN